ncbi:MAG: SMP-30/gluconolactonase/LRE family protein [Flavobacteriaceae bacterium]
MPEPRMGHAELLFDAKATLGEGPVWDWKRQLLFWVDIEGKQLHCHHPTTGKNTNWSFDDMVGAAVPMNNGNLLMALESGMAEFGIESGKLTALGLLENSDPEMRYNDGKVSPNGHFWIGSMHKNFHPKSGNLYRVQKNRQTAVLVRETAISNGMAWTSDNKTFYYIDSPTFQIMAFDFDASTDSLSNPRVAFTVPKDYGSPDGMCIDVENKLWIGHWGGNQVRRWDPDTGNVLENVWVGAPHVTSCCFGGKQLDSLYITTARSGLNKAQIKRFPLSGGLFVYRPKVAGTPIDYF